jgi:serine/threonine protein phosphatase PrpC
LIVETILSWLNAETPSRAARDVENQFLIATDVGPTRAENQDKAAVLRIGSAAINREFWCACVCDGMGGLKDGNAAASNAVAHFFASLIANRKSYPTDRLEKAVRDASAAVAQIVPGGGATLSAALFEEGTAYTANVGDSRIYAVRSSPTKGTVDRLTVDDTMAEAYGAEGRGLLQFIGMKSGLMPHVGPIPNGDVQLLLTTDGVHFIGDETISRIAANSPDVSTLCNRLLDTAQWFGSSDNATIIACKPSGSFARSASGEHPDISIWTAAGRLKIAWTPSAQHELAARQPSSELDANSRDAKGASISSADTSTSADKSPVKDTSPTAPKKKGKSSSKRQKREQIEIGFADDGGS